MLFLIRFFHVAGSEAEVGIIMGSDSDLSTMRAAAQTLQSLGVKCEVTIVSAHRTPERMMSYACSAHTRGLKVNACTHLLSSIYKYTLVRFQASSTDSYCFSCQGASQGFHFCCLLFTTEDTLMQASLENVCLFPSHAYRTC